jgi:hypothetical protein
MSASGKLSTRLPGKEQIMQWDRQILQYILLGGNVGGAVLKASRFVFGNNRWQVSRSEVLQTMEPLEDSF